MRHPLDLLVSMFHSFTKTHKLPPGATTADEKAEWNKERSDWMKEGIDQYSMRVWDQSLSRQYAMIAERLDYYDRNPATCAVMLSRYEDFVMRPQAWLDSLLDFYGVHNAATRATVHGDLERQRQMAHPNEETGHVAYLWPGSFVDHLDNRTVIHVLFRSSQAIMRHMGYW